ncbi:MAG: hypothetical protein ACD_60C00137G0011 [uncultured bacterium]|nr:MAG: hypothetical protein ACD_60C00137G0011 [uncultured bacterium]
MASSRNSSTNQLTGEEKNIENPVQFKEINTNEYHDTYSYYPQVKNWFCKEDFIADSSRWSYGDLLQSESDKNAWVSFPELADLRFSITTQLENHQNPKLSLNITACFDPPGYKDDVYIPQFLEPFQDRARIIVSPITPNHCSLIKYKGDLDSSANINNKENIVRIYTDAKVTVGIDSGAAHANVTKGYNAIRSEMKIHDFNMFSRSSGGQTIYTVTQQRCYHKGTSYPYDIQHPDASMHWYGNFPDYFSTPSTLAMGGLVLNTNQIYSLRESHGELNCDFNINLHQHLVGMSMWRWCANHSFTHDTHAKISLTTQNGMLAKIGFFKIKIPTQHTRTHIWNTNESTLDSRSFLHPLTP